MQTAGTLAQARQNTNRIMIIQDIDISALYYFTLPDDPHVEAITDENLAIVNSSFLHNQFWLDQFDHAHQPIAVNEVI